MREIIFSSFDPSFTSWGNAKLRYKPDVNELEVLDLVLIPTQKRSGKTVRVSSDNLRRASELYEAMVLHTKGSAVAFTEVPSGGQSASAVYSFGIVVGLLAACPIPLIQIQQHETKLAAVGTKTASKEEMIEWATESFPDAPWLYQGKRLLKANEHLADAVAVGHAGIRTDDFKRLLAMARAAA